MSAAFHMTQWISLEYLVDGLHFCQLFILEQEQSAC